MAKGKFEGSARNQAARNPGSVSRGTDTARKNNTQPRSRKKSGGKVWPIMLAVLGAVIVLGGAALLLKDSVLPELFHRPTEAPDPGLIADRVYAAGVDLSGMDEEQAMAALQAAAPAYEKQMHLSVRQTAAKGEEAPAPVELSFPASQTGIVMSAENAYREAYRVGRELTAPAEGERFVVDPESYLSMDTGGIREQLKQTAQSLGAGSKLEQTSVKPTHEKRDVDVPQSDGTTKTESRDVTLLHFTVGTSEVSLKEDELFQAVMDAYAAAEFDVDYAYTRTVPDPVDIDKLEKEYCTEAVDATYDKTRHEITDEVPGKGFDREELESLLDKSPEGAEFDLEIRDIEPEVTAADLRASLFSDALATVSTPLTAYWNRTHNIELACQAINGTIVLPGEVFSFNATVGIRTEAKGYLPATAYVSGGASAEEIGGGVCQVASSIYYATLLSDLETVERYAHMYAVTYVPMGMDAAIYWGAQDFQFRNNTDYPLRIDALVSGGYVNIQLVGTDERSYRVEMTYDILETIPWEEKEVETNEVLPGTVITTAYTGYRVATYMHKIDKATGQEISVDRVAYSNYNKRDREVAIPLGGWFPTEPTEPFDGGSMGGSQVEPTDSYDPPATDPYTPTETDPWVPDETDPWIPDDGGFDDGGFSDGGFDDGGGMGTWP